MSGFGNELDSIRVELPTMAGEIKPELLNSDDEKAYLKEIKKRNKYYLIEGLSDNLISGEKQRIANHILRLYEEALPSHLTLCEKLTTIDDTSRLVRKEVLGSSGELPNYRTPLSYVSLETIHANEMNVFFSPQDIMRVIPTANDDVPKVNNISVFGNWSMKNEMDIFSNCDRLFHSSGKNGEGVAMIYWKKEYGTDMKFEPIRDEQGNIVYDEETKDPVGRWVEISKLIYDAPFMEVIDRKDYIQPKDCIMNQTPEWEGRIVRISYDTVLRDELQGKYYDGSVGNIKSWASPSLPEVEKANYDGDDYQVPGWDKEFLEWYGRMKINVVEENLTDEEASKALELEDEFIAVVHIKSKTLCAIRHNRFPLKKRPFVNDYFVPDDTGRRAGLGVYELMESMQKAYDAMYNEFIYAIELSNKPIIFYTPTGNMRDEKLQVQAGFMYPSSDPGSVKLFNFPPPNEAMQIGLQLIQQWAQFMFGISDYAAGMQSKIDADAPAKKAALIVDQGNVRLNIIIKRKNDTLKEIFKRWFMLYKANMPPNKFMRVAGEGNDPWKFSPISFEDFDLQSIPDFELTGNILNANKQLEANKAIAIYQMLSTNFLFNPQSQAGIQAYTQLTKYLINKIGDSQLNSIVPGTDEGGVRYTPAEENALLLQGQVIEPKPDEDFSAMINAHMQFYNDPNVPDSVKPLVKQHIDMTVAMMRQVMQQKMAMQQQAQNAPQGQPAQPGQPQAPQPGPQPIQNRISPTTTMGGAMPINHLGSVNKVGGAGMPGKPGMSLPNG